MLINQMYWQSIWAECVSGIKHTPRHKLHTREEEQVFLRRLEKLRHSSFLRYACPASDQG